MLAARFHAAHGLRLEDVPTPEPGPTDVLVRVRACGICLSDVHLIDGSLPPVADPVIPGHEAMGEVAATGGQVTGWQPGDVVSLMGGKACGDCERCRRGRPEDCLAPQVMGFHYDGAWAEYVAVPSTALIPVPPGLEDEQVAILADAVATPFAALVERAAVRPGESVGLWGIGGLGTHAVQIARHLLGAGLVIAIDPLESARARALGAGADVVIDPTVGDVVGEVWASTGRGLDVAVDLVGANAVLQQADRCLSRGGRLVSVGMSAEPMSLGPNVLFNVMSHAVLGHLGYERAHLETLVQLLSRGRLDLRGSVTEVLPLTDIAEGVRRLEHKLGDPVRLVVRP